MLISVVHRKGVALDGKAPLLLYGYGSYGASGAPTSSSSRLSLLNRGVCSPTPTFAAAARWEKSGASRAG